MKGIFTKCIFLLLLVLTACTKDEEIINNIQLPEDTSNEQFILKTTPISGNNVLLDWQINKTLETSEVTHTIAVNGTTLAENIESSSYAFDAFQFKEEEESTVILDIIITTFSKGEEKNQLFKIDATEIIELNSDPTEVKIISLNVNLTNFNAIEVFFTKPIDKDNDALTYDFLINDELIEKDITFNEGSADTNNSTDPNNIAGVQRPALQTINLAYDFLSNINDDITLKIIAKDTEGGKSETERTFNLTKTDVDFGKITPPFEKNTEVMFTSDEVDNRIRFSFEIDTENTGINLESKNNNLDFILYNSEGDIIDQHFGRFNNLSLKRTLEIGNYELEVINSSFDTSKNTFSMRVLEVTNSDKDFEQITLPFVTNETYNFGNEFDNAIIYNFELTETSVLKLKNTSENGESIRFDVFNETTNRISSSSILDNDEFYLNNTLTAGKYTIRFTNDNLAMGSIDLSFLSINNNDEDFGLISLPFNTSKNLNLITEIDQNITYTFEVDEAAFYRFEFLNTSDRFDMFLRNKNTGSTVKSDFFTTQISSRFDNALTPGVYELTIVNNNNNFRNSNNYTLLLEIGKAIVETTDLGVISFPYENELILNFDNGTNFINNSTFIYNFEVTSDAGYVFKTDNNVSFTLKNEFGSTINSTRNDVFNSNGLSLNKGIYSLEVSNEFNSNNVNLSIFITDKDTIENIDLGTITSFPYSESFDFDFSKQVDNEIEFNFTVSQNASYRIGTGLEQTDIVIREKVSAFDSGYTFDSNSRGIISNDKRLSPIYYYTVVIRKRNNANAKGSLKITLE